MGVSDLDAAVGFYTEALGLRLAMRLGGEWAAIDAGGGLIIGLEPDGSGGRTARSPSGPTNHSNPL